MGKGTCIKYLTTKTTDNEQSKINKKSTIMELYDIEEKDKCYVKEMYTRLSLRHTFV